MGGQFHFDPDTYLEMIVSEVPAYEELQRETARAVSGVPVERILELGVGTGETTQRVLAVYPDAHLIGIDESDAMLEHARSRQPGADLRVGLIEDALPEGDFDLVVSSLTVHHLDDAGKADLFRRIGAVLRPGGRVVLADVVVPDDPRDAVTPIDGDYDKPSRADDQMRWLADAGLRPRLAWQDADLAILVADRPA